MFYYRIYSINSGGDGDEKITKCSSFFESDFFQEFSAHALQNLDHIKSHFLISDSRAFKPLFIRALYFRSDISVIYVDVILKYAAPTVMF